MLQNNLVEFLKSLGAGDLRFVLGKEAPDQPGAGVSGGTAPGRGRRKAPCCPKTFTVPPEVKHLDHAGLSTLTESFTAWRDIPANPARARSRSRVWLLYLVVRYGALKLGEAIALDDRYDLDFTNSTVRVGGENARQVQLPKEAAAEIEKVLSSPMMASLRGEVFALDQGFVRRKFYERADACGIPRELANPRGLRHSRAVELLREGVPLTVVQSLLGHQNVNLTAQYVSFSEQDIQRIVNYYILKETQMKTSARNSFTGKVAAIRAGDILAEVEVVTPAGLRVVSVITLDSLGVLGIREGSLVTATVKAPWVVLVKEGMQLNTSARNKYCGTVVQVNEGKISAEVIVELPDGTKICSLVTDESVKVLDMKVGDPICALFKAFSVILNAE